MMIRPRYVSNLRKSDSSRHKILQFSRQNIGPMPENVDNSGGDKYSS